MRKPRSADATSVFALLVITGIGCLLLPAAAGAETRTFAAAVYGGTTKGGDPVVVTATPKNVKSITLRWLTSCPSGAHIPWAGTARFRGVPTSGPPATMQTNRLDLYTTPLTKKGGFAGNIYSILDLGDGYNGFVSGTLSGRLTAKGGGGGFVIILSTFDPQGNLIERCGADDTWKVGRGPDVMAGATSQDEPLVLILNRRRTKIQDMFVGYKLDCPQGQFLQWSDDLTFLLSSGGKFGDRFNSGDVAIDGGGSRRVFYDVSGTLGAKNGKGRLAVWTAETDPEGNLQTEGCSTPNLTWSARSG